jgi:hypothetical protein
MSAMQRDKYGWIRTALMEAGKEQKDLAKAWKCDAAVVSRWVKTGTPRLTIERAGILAGMLNMSREELLTRVEGNLAPQGGTIARAVAARELPAAPAPAVALDSVLAVLDAQKEMAAAAARVQARLPPGLKVVFSIEKE